MTDLTGKITQYSQISDLLFIAGIVFIVIAAVMFFRFNIPHIIDRITGFGERKERAKILAEMKRREQPKEDFEENEDEAPTDDNNNKESRVKKPVVDPWDDTEALKRMFDLNAKKKTEKKIEIKEDQKFQINKVRNSNELTRKDDISIMDFAETGLLQQKETETDILHQEDDNFEIVRTVIRTHREEEK